MGLWGFYMLGNTRKHCYFSHGRHCALEIAARACLEPPVALEIAAQACSEPPVALEIAAQACSEPPVALEIAAQACSQPPLALEIPARACLALLLALDIASKSLFRVAGLGDTKRCLTSRCSECSVHVGPAWRCLWRSRLLRSHCLKPPVSVTGPGDPERCPTSRCSALLRAWICTGSH